MFKENEFLSAVVKNGYNLKDVSSELGINYATLYRKMKGESEFTRNELQSIKRFLNLSNKDIINIFFS